MTIEELLSKSLSNEIDIQILKELMKSAKVSKDEKEKYIEQMVKRQDIKMERDLLGGNKNIHGTEE